MSKAKTKDDVIEENKLLKDKLKELSSKVKQSILGENMEGIGMGLIKIGEDFQLVKLSFNPETLNAKVDSVIPIQGNSRDMAVALYRAKEFLVQEIFQKIK